MGDLEGKQIRVGILGASSVGKTCIVKRFVENSFHSTVPTPGVDFFARRMSLKTVGTVTYIIVDIGASCLSSKMLPIYIHGIDVFLLAYDMTNATSLNELRKWITIISAFSGGRNYEPSMAIVGCKGDLEHLRSVRLDAHTRFAQEYNIPLSFLASAKSGESVLTCFSKCAIYHLNPEAKQRVLQHGILQSVSHSKKGSASSSGTQNPMFMPPAAQGVGIPKVVGAAANSSQNSRAVIDPNSTVCVLQ